MLKKLMSIVLSLVLLLSMATIVQAEDGELEILANPPKNHVYTEIVYNKGKTEMTIFGYVNEEGTPQFRIYGKVGKTKGFFPITISSDGELTVESAEPVKDNKKMFGEAKIASDKMDIPEGFSKTNKKNIFRIENIFGEKEHVAYASYDGENYYYFPIAKNNQPVPGSFPMDLDDMVERSKKTNGNKKYKKPADFKDGFSKGIILLTSDGGELKTFTAGPVLDIDEIKASKGRSFGYGGGHRGGSNSSSSNGNVKFAQNILKQLGFLSGAVDGKLGDQTKKAISAFQAKNGLVQTGSLDKGTMEKLRGNTAINAQGKTVLLKTIGEAKDKAAALAAVKGLKVAVTVQYGRLGTNETQTFTVKPVANPNGLNNFTLTLEVRGPEGFVQQFNATGGSTSHSFKTAGSYRACLWINGAAGTVGGDVKEFTVYQGDAQLPDDHKISPEDAAKDRFLKVSPGGSFGKAVAKGQYAQIIVNLNNTIANHTYSITVSGPNLNTTQTGTTFNANVQMLDGSEKVYTVTAKGFLNGVETRTITAQYKILAENTTPGGTGGSVVPGNIESHTIQEVHQGDVPQGVTNTTTKVKDGGTWTTTYSTTYTQNGYTYTGVWNPDRSVANIKEDKTIVCQWTKTPVPTDTPNPNPDTPNPNPDTPNPPTDNQTPPTDGN